MPVGCGNKTNLVCFVIALYRKAACGYRGRLQPGALLWVLFSGEAWCEQAPSGTGSRIMISAAASQAISGAPGFLQHCREVLWFLIIKEKKRMATKEGQNKKKLPPTPSDLCQPTMNQAIPRHVFGCIKNTTAITVHM